MSSCAEPPASLLFLVADTGGGHRAAAAAIGAELGRVCPGRFTPILCDPLAGPGSPLLLRLVTRLYAPTVRLTPWLWAAAWHATNSGLTTAALRRVLLSPARRPVAEAAARHHPAAIVSFHPLATDAAVAIPGLPVATVVTDLVTPHLSWALAGQGPMIVPTAAAGQCLSGDPGRIAVTGLPVAAPFRRGPASPRERVALRRSLGLPGQRFTVVLTGGAEGCGGLTRRAAAVLRRCPDVQVVAICGRNQRLRRRLDRLAERSGGRLTVRGFVDNMADWLRCADVVAGKAGPGTIAEAACCGAALLLTSRLPGQERGNPGYVTAAGAGRYVPSVRTLTAAVTRLQTDRAHLDAMRASATGLARPDAATTIATVLADLATPPKTAAPTEPVLAHV